MRSRQEWRALGRRVVRSDTSESPLRLHSSAKGRAS